MTAEAINLIHELATPQLAREHLERAGYVVSDEAIEYIIGSHFDRRSTALRHLDDRNWPAFREQLEGMAAKLTHELPEDIAEHRLTRVDLEAKAQRILLCQKLAELAARRSDNH